MKLFLIAALSGLAAASASSSEQAVTLRGSSAEASKVTEYAPPEPTKDADLKTLWDQLAAEAAFMQVHISEGRTHGQCIDDCNNAQDVNRARCRRNCDQIDDNGGSTTDRTFNCNDCRTLPDGGRRRERCMNACRQGQVDNIERCLDANTCSQCRNNCGDGTIAEQDCLDDLNCPGGSDRSGRCYNAQNCRQCRDFCSTTDNQLDRCLDDFNCSGRSSSQRCRDAETCTECNDWCDNTTDRQNCRDREGCTTRNSNRCVDANNCNQCYDWCNLRSERNQCFRDINRSCDSEDFEKMLAQAKVGGVYVQK